MREKAKTVILGLVFLSFLGLAYLENVMFFSFNYLEIVFSNVFLAVVLVFVHNVLAVSLILLGMTFYVQLVLTCFHKRRHEYVVLEHPRVFAFVFTVLILMLSIFRVSMLLYGTVFVSALWLIILFSVPNGLLEGYGIFLTLRKTFERNMTLKDLALVYFLFFAATLIEVGFIQVVQWSTYH